MATTLICKLANSILLVLVSQGRGSSWQDSLVLSAGGTQLSGVGPAVASAAAATRQVGLTHILARHSLSHLCSYVAAMNTPLPAQSLRLISEFVSMCMRMSVLNDDVRLFASTCMLPACPQSEGMGEAGEVARIFEERLSDALLGKTT